MWNISSPPAFPCPLLHSQTPSQRWDLDSFYIWKQSGFTHKTHLKWVQDSENTLIEGVLRCHWHHVQLYKFLAHCHCWKNCWIVINFILQVCILIYTCEIRGRRNGSLLGALKSLKRFLREISLLVTRNADWKVWGVGVGREKEFCLHSNSDNA